MRFNAMLETFDPVELFHKPALFTNARVDRETVPPGLFAYDIRHNEDGIGATVEKNVFVDHMGTVIFAEPLDFGKEGHIPLTDDNGGLNFEAGHDCTTIAEYQEYVAGTESRSEVYLHPAAYAREHDELPLFRHSNNLNRECAKAIDAAITANWSGSSLNAEGMKAVIQQYGPQRVNLVLANTVCEMEYDRRFSQANRDWAKSLPRLHSDAFMLKSHPVKLDDFISHVRRGGIERLGAEE